MKTIDLHVHTTASDGTDAPAEVVEQAAALGLAAVGITDHDSTAGIGPALEAGRRLGVEVVPGIEVSSDYRDNNVHILGYFVQAGSPALRPVLEWVTREREERNRKIVGMLAGDGFDISMEQLKEEYPGAVLGRPHMAEHLMRRGYTASVKEGFDRYLGTGRPYYLPRRRISMERAVEVIRQAGGLAVLAHPYQYGYPDPEREELLETARRLGIQALEAYYSLHTPGQQAALLAKAEAWGLGVSGGSDYHGSRKPHIRLGSGQGDLSVPLQALEGLKSLWRASRAEG